MKGRPRQTVSDKADREEVRALLRNKNLEGWKRQRLQMALLALAGTHTLPEIAGEVGVHPRTVSTWLELLQQGGLEKLLTREPKAKGPQSWLDEETAAQLQEQLRHAHWRRAAEARAWLEQKLGRKLSLVVVYKYLGKSAARLKVPRPLHRRQNPQAVETFRATLSAQRHAKDVPLERSVHLWVMDEMRFGLQPVTRRVWTVRGVDPVVSVEPRYQWGYTYGALEVCAGGAEFLHTDGVSQAATAAFYEQIGASHPDAMHLVIQDGAGFHLPAGHALLPANVEVVTLPAYSPELNPIEKLWDIIKDRICNRVWPELDALRAAIDVVLHEYWTDSRLVRSLVGQGTIERQVNSSSKSVLVV